MKTNKIHPIKFVAAQTGLKAHNIRSWEERYRAVSPKRTATNRRLYSDDDIRRLALLKTAVEFGHTISSVAQLSDNQLLGVIQRNRERSRSPGDRPTEDPSSPTRMPDERYDRVIQDALSHVVRLDSLALESVLSDAAVGMPRHAFLKGVIVPLFEEIGLLWRNGQLKIINEHMASVIVRAMLWEMLRSVNLSTSAPRILIATPAGHWHEFGALACALVASESGWQPYYFGPDLPSEEIVYAARKVNANALALSICHLLNHHKLIGELKRIRRLSEDKLPIFVGGSGADKALAGEEAIGVTVVTGLDDFRHHIESLET
jgi:DNA-binding transcriptional MerR regulator/methylmalonyl-CoA mutase cobalamin-binding subunit